MGNVDLVQWVISMSGAYTYSSAWNEIRVKDEEVISWKLIWHNPFIPKYSYLLVSYSNQAISLGKAFETDYVGDVLFVFVLQKHN